MPALLRHIAAPQDNRNANGVQAVALPANEGPRIELLVPSEASKPPLQSMRSVTMTVDGDSVDQQDGDSCVIDSIGHLVDESATACHVLWPSQEPGALPKNVLIVHRQQFGQSGSTGSITCLLDMDKGTVTRISGASAQHSSADPALRWPGARRHTASCVVVKPTAPLSDAVIVSAAGSSAAAAAPAAEEPKAAAGKGGKGAPVAPKTADTKKGAPEQPAIAAPPPVSEVKPLGFPLMLMFGGIDVATSHPCEDLYAFHVDNAAVQQALSMHAPEKASAAPWAGAGAPQERRRGSVAPSVDGPASTDGLALAIDKPLWLKVKSSGQWPGPRVHHSLTASGSGTRAVLFGGFGVHTATPHSAQAGHADAVPPAALLNDAWVLDCQTWTWTCVIASGIPPAPRARHASAGNGFLPDALSLQARPWQLSVAADLRAVLPVYRTMADVMGRQPFEATESELHFEADPSESAHDAAAPAVPSMPPSRPSSAGVHPSPSSTPAATATIGPDVVFIFGGVCAPAELAKARAGLLEAPHLKKKSGVDAHAAADDMHANAQLRTARADDMCDPVIYALVLDAVLAAALAPLQPPPARPALPPVVEQVVTAVEAPVAPVTAVDQGKAGKGGKSAAKDSAKDAKGDAKILVPDEPVAAPTPPVDPYAPTAVWTSLPAVIPPMATGKSSAALEGALLGLRPLQSLDGDSELLTSAPTGGVAPLPFLLDSGDSMVSVAFSGDAVRMPSPDRGSSPGKGLRVGAPSVGSGRATYTSMSQRKYDSSLRRFGHSASSVLVTRPTSHGSISHASSSADFEGKEMGEGEGETTKRAETVPRPAIGVTHSLYVVLYGGVTDSHMRSAAKRLARGGPGPMDNPVIAAAMNIPAGVLVELLPHEVLKEQLSAPVAEQYDGYGGFVLRARDPATGVEVVRRSYNGPQEFGTYEGDSDAGVRTGQGHMTWQNKAGHVAASTSDAHNVLGLPGSLSSGSWVAYDGGWQNDSPHGHGCVTFIDGRVYRGDISCGVLLGYGNMSAHGSHNSAAVGAGHGPLPDAAAEPAAAVTVRGLHIVTYEGDWADGLPCGQGVVGYACGSFSGVVGSAGLPWGPGTLSVRVADGRSIDATGEWKDGYLQGPGQWVLTAVSGAQLEVYRGPFASGVRHGVGAVVDMRDGAHYEGPYKNGRRNGHGMCRYPNKDLYNGKFIGDARAGKGTLIKSNGDRYAGCWEEDAMHGPGVFTYTVKETEVAGVWNKGVLQ